VFYSALGYAVEQGLLGANPVDRIQMRSVPIPPDLVTLLRAHIRRTAPARTGGCSGGREGAIQQSTYGVSWQAARTAAQHASPLARRTYDLRHAAHTPR
jgi:hypothetical protein